MELKFSQSQYKAMEKGSGYFEILSGVGSTMVDSASTDLQIESMFRGMNLRRTITEHF